MWYKQSQNRKELVMLKEQGPDALWLEHCGWGGHWCKMSEDGVVIEILDSLSSPSPSRADVCTCTHTYVSMPFASHFAIPLTKADVFSHPWTSGLLGHFLSSMWYKQLAHKNRAKMRRQPAPGHPARMWQTSSQQIQENESCFKPEILWWFALQYHWADESQSCWTLCQNASVGFIPGRGFQSQWCYLISNDYIKKPLQQFRQEKPWTKARRLTVREKQVESRNFVVWRSREPKWELGGWGEVKRREGSVCSMWNYYSIYVC